jgi:hypothetical protein
VRYEDLVREPLQALGRLYEQLRLGDYSGVEPAIKAEMRLRGEYAARSTLPPEPWMRRLQAQWAPVFERYHYALRR